MINESAPGMTTTRSKEEEERKKEKERGRSDMEGKWDG